MDINEEIVPGVEAEDIKPGMWKCDFKAFHPTMQQCDCDHE